MSVEVKWLWLKKCCGAEGTGCSSAYLLFAVTVRAGLKWGKTAARHSLINYFGFNQHYYAIFINSKHVIQQAVGCVDEQRHKWASVFFFWS